LDLPFYSNKYGNITIMHKSWS